VRSIENKDGGVGGKFREGIPWKLKRMKNLEKEKVEK